MGDADVTAIDAPAADRAAASADAAGSACTVGAAIAQIHAGGGASGAFVADADFDGGTAYDSGHTVRTAGIADAAPADVYRTYRYGSTAPFSYRFSALAPGSLARVRLHFAETYNTAVAQRLFDVAINGQTVLPSLDVFAQAGGADRALVQTLFARADATGALVVTFSPIAGHDSAMVSGLELAPASGACTAADAGVPDAGAPDANPAPEGGRTLGGTSDVNDLTAYPATVAPPGPVAIPTCGVTLAPGSDIQSAVDASPAGTVFCLVAGTWNGTGPSLPVVITPKANDAFYGVRAGVTVLSNIAFHAASGVNNVTVANLTIHDPLTTIYQGLAGVESNNARDLAQGWRVLNNEVYHCNSGVSVGSDSVVSNNYLHDNYEQGFSGGGSHSLFEYNASIHNAATAPPDSGNKSGEADGTTWAHNYLADSGMSGIWCDVDCRNAQYVENVFVRNHFVGLMSEIDGGGNVMRGNLAGGNGGGASGARTGQWQNTGILISSSHNDTITGNYAWSNGSTNGDIVLYYQGREPDEGSNTVTGNVTSVAIHPGNATDTLSGNTVTPAAEMHVPRVVAGLQM